jgi:hypothetical protein
VEAERGVGLELREQPFLEHQRGAALLAGRRAFLGGLEHEQDLARKLGAPRREDRRDAEQDRGVRVVPHACMTPTVSPLNVAFAFDANGTSTCSVTGSASMSARSTSAGPACRPSGAR